jgi:triphosphoribosyl-dephospho-CoA synthase
VIVMNVASRGAYRPRWPEVAAGEDRLADAAVAALVEEAELTPKPALVDSRSSGAHADLNLEIMLRSAHALRAAFAAMARAAVGQEPSQELRERLAAIGREGELAMQATTGGTNTHRGAIWTLGLLVASAAMSKPGATAHSLAVRAGEIARFVDRHAPQAPSHGSRVRERYGVWGAHGEARRGFSHVVGVGLPVLYAARARALPEGPARLDALIAIMASLDDTCLLHRGGLEALNAAKHGARACLRAGGTSAPSGWKALLQLDAALLARNASPGGSADLLAATLFLDRLNRRRPTVPFALQNGGDPTWRS